MSTDARIYLIPTWLDDSARESLPEYVLEAIRECQVFFVEDERLWSEQWLLIIELDVLVSLCDAGGSDGSVRIWRLLCSHKVGCAGGCESVAAAGMNR